MSSKPQVRFACGPLVQISFLSKSCPAFRPGHGRTAESHKMMVNAVAVLRTLRVEPPNGVSCYEGTNDE
jgi:hypothetical protein